VSALHFRDKNGNSLSAKLRSLLTSGLSPRKLALTISFGAATGVMPLPWGTSILCAAWAGLLRLNQGAIQAVNYCCYPLQIALFVPLCRLGELIFPWGPQVSLAVLKRALRGDLGLSANIIGYGIARGIGAWLVTVVPLMALGYPVLVKMLLRRQEKMDNPG
jgi:hypothetical protein